jgi:hypothetical protein
LEATTALPEPETMTVPLLREELEQRNVEIPSDAKKEDLVRLLRAARAEDDSEAEDPAAVEVAREGEFIPSGVQARNLPAVQAHEAIVARSEISVDELTAQAEKIKVAMGAVMRPDIHYGKIPGVNKPTLLKPGAHPHRARRRGGGGALLVARVEVRLPRRGPRLPDLRRRSDQEVEVRAARGRLRRRVRARPARLVLLREGRRVRRQLPRLRPPHHGAGDGEGREP